MSDLLMAVLDAIGEHEDIEFIPYDIRGMKLTEQMQIYALYAEFGKDPDRRKLCRKKYQEVIRYAAG